MLDIGQSIRYRKIGSGTIVDKKTRPFCGQEREFMVIEFPHRDMKAELPIGDPNVSENLFKVSEIEDLDLMLKYMHAQGDLLPRTWNIRKEAGDQTITEGGPQEWIELLGSYSIAAGAGVPITASDKTLVENLIEIIASEYACAADIRFAEALDQIKEYYQTAAKKIEKMGYEAEHFETMPELPEIKTSKRLAKIDLSSKNLSLASMA